MSVPTKKRPIKKKTQKQLAQLLEVEQAYVSKIEGAKIPIGKRMAGRLGGVFKLSYKVFLSGLPDLVPNVQTKNKN